MKVLSLFDGMSCGQIALNRIGVIPTNYYASEVDKFAITVTQANYPDTIQLGDVTKWKEWDIDWAAVDLLIGGSPCQGFSVSGKKLAFEDPRSKLFFEYVDILNHIKRVNPSVKFLLENVKMKKHHLDVITKRLGVEPVQIDSSLVSAQVRKRYYWCNWALTQPSDKGLLLRHLPFDSFMLINERMSKISGNLATIKAFQKNVRTFDQKHKTILAGGIRPASSGGCNIKHGNNWLMANPVGAERLQTVPDNYTNHVSNTQRYKMLGNGWTVDVIAHIFSQAGFGQLALDDDSNEECGL